MNSRRLAAGAHPDLRQILFQDCVELCAARRALRVELAGMDKVVEEDGQLGVGQQFLKGDQRRRLNRQGADLGQASGQKAYGNVLLHPAQRRQREGDVFSGAQTRGQREVGAKFHCFALFSAGPELRRRPSEFTTTVIELKAMNIAPARGLSIPAMAIGTRATL